MMKKDMVLSAMKCRHFESVKKTCINCPSNLQTEKCQAVYVYNLLLDVKEKLNA